MGDKYSLWEKGELMSDAIFEKNCIFMMMEKMPSATGEFLRQVAFFLIQWVLAGMQETLFHEFELTDEFVTWAEQLFSSSRWEEFQSIIR